MNIPEKLLALNPGFFGDEIFKTNCEKILKCTPFIGSGMSVTFGFPTWPEFLKKAGKEFKRNDVVNEIENGKCDYEKAASEIFNYAGKKWFRNYGEKIFNNKVAEEDITGTAIELLPDLFEDTHVITTNYDNVLSKVYARRKDGKYMPVINYTNKNNADAAMFEEEPSIIKLHGSFNIGEEYIFTKEQYDSVYADPEFKELLHSVLTRKPLLFMGCSLIHERFLRTWSNVIAQNENLNHYAIMPTEVNSEEQAKLREKLDQYNISVIWYPIGDYDMIRTLLELIGKETGKIPDEYMPVPYNHSYVDRSDEYNANTLLKSIYGGNDSQAILSNMQKRFKSKFVYITGLGGIGKTTLLNRLYHYVYNEISEHISAEIKIAHMEFNVDWKTTLRSRRININDKKGKYILFIDTLPDGWLFEENNDFKEFASNCQIFVASRDKIEKSELSRFADLVSELHYIDLGWEFPNSKDLFIAYFSSDRRSLLLKNNSIDELVRMSGNHTLTIEILANHARESCSFSDKQQLAEKLEEYTNELKAKKFDLRDLQEIGEKDGKAAFYSKITEHLKLLVDMDKLSEGEKYLLQVFSLLAETTFNPEHIGFEFQHDCMEHLLRLGWVKRLTDNDYVMHEIVKKLVYDKDKEDRIGYFKMRDLVFCIGKSLAKRTIEKAGSTVFAEMNNISHAQSLYDYFKRTIPQDEDIDILDSTNPYNDSAFVEMVNNLFSSYDDIDLREKAFNGSVEAEMLSRNTHDYALYSHAVSANSIGYLCVHSRKDSLPDEEQLPHAFQYLLSAEESINRMFDKDNKEAMVLKGKILSNLGAYYNACLKLSINLRKQKQEAGECVDNALEKRIKREFDEARRYHELSRILRENLYSQYGDKDMRDHIFTSKENVANDHYQIGDLAEAVKIREAFLPEFIQYYGEKEHIKKFLTLRNLGDTCKNIVISLSKNEEVIGVDKSEFSMYKEKAQKYLNQAKAERILIDKNEDVIKKIDEGLKVLDNICCIL